MFSWNLTLKIKDNTSVLYKIKKEQIHSNNEKEICWWHIGPETWTYANVD